MPVRVRIPTPLRRFAGGAATVEVEAATVAQALERLTLEHPELRRHLFAEDGNLRNFVNIYLNQEDVRYRERQETPVADGDTLLIVPSIAGGSA